MYEIIRKIKDFFSDSFIFTTNKSKTKVLLEQHFDENLNKFKKLVLKNKEIPNNFNSDLWNKLVNLKNNGNLQLKYKKVLLSDKSSTNLIFNNRDNIANWADTNYLNSNIITKFIEKLGKIYY